MFSQVGLRAKTVLKAIRVSELTYNSWLKSRLNVISKRHLGGGSADPPNSNQGQNTLINEVLYHRLIAAKSCHRLTLKSHQYSVILTPSVTLDDVVQLSLMGNEASKLSENDCGILIAKEDDHVIVESSKIVGVDNATLNLQIPFNLNLDLHCFNSSGLRMSGLECRNVAVNVESGSFTSTNIKCQQISVYNRRGNINCEGYLIGNAYLRADECGRIAVKRIQGNDVHLKSVDGNVNAGAIYCESCKIFCRNADLTLANVHGDCDAQIQMGNVQINGLDGQLTACVNRGDITVQISKLKSPSHSVLIAREGDVDLKLNPELTASIRLEGKDVIMDEDVSSEGQFMDGDENHVVYQGHLNGSQLSQTQQPLVIGIAHNGKVHLGMQSWFSNFKHL